MYRKDYIDIMKGLAIFSVVCAHTSTIDQNAQYILSVLGIMGVPVFFFISGFLYNNTELFQLISKKKYLVSMWIISGTIIYCYVYLRKYSISITTYVAFISGINSYLYYLSTYFIIIIIMHFILKIKKQYVYYLFLFSSLCFLFNQNISVFGSIRPMSFLCYFLMGYWFKKRNIKISSEILKFVMLFLSIVVICMANWNLNYVSYFGINGFITGISSIVLIYCLSVSIENSQRIFSKQMIYLGRTSFYIYIWHMLFMGVVNKLEFFNPFIKPVICIIVTVIFIEIWGFFRLYLKNNININKH